MAGEYYRWLARDVEPGEKRELTRDEKRRNWWAYHKWYVIIGLVVLLLIGDTIYDIIDTRNNRPDYTIAYVGAAALSDEAVGTLKSAFTELGEDVSGNGEIVVELRQYCFTSGASSTEEVLVGEQSLAGSAPLPLLSDLDACKSVIFLLEDPQSFQAEFRILAYSDGALPEDGLRDESLWLPLSEYPALSDLGLGNLYIARRGFWNGETSNEIQAALALWDRLR